MSVLLLRAFSFKKLSPLFGYNLGAVACCPIADASSTRRAVAISQAIKIAANRMPLRNDCLPQALVGQVLCRIMRVPSALHFGVAKEHSGSIVTAGLQAHAWIASGNVAVTGSLSFFEFIPTSCFVSRRPTELKL